MNLFESFADSTVPLRNELMPISKMNQYRKAGQ